MSDYSQPEFYRFNQDSLKLVSKVCSSIGSARRILDIGAGCGVIGIELAKYFPSASLTLLEAQASFLPFLKTNCELFLSGRSASIQHSSIGQWKTTEVYDLIVCNPPYYLVGHGRTGQDERRTIARTFVLEGWETLLRRISQLLSQDGLAFLVIKNDQRILQEVSRYCSSLRCSSATAGDLRFLTLSGLDVD